MHNNTMINHIEGHIDLNDNQIGNCLTYNRKNVLHRLM